MPFEKGKSGNPGGRKPGTANKVTGDLRQFFEDFIRQNAGAMQRDFNKLSAKDRILFIEKLAKYVLPSMQAVSVETIDRLSPEQLDTIFDKIMQNLNSNEPE